jgi:cell division control protein 6
LEFDQITPAVRNLPLQQKLVLFSILINEKNGLRNISTGEVYATYEFAVARAGERALGTRRVSSIISDLDMMGLIAAKTISRGRQGRTKRINSCLPPAFDALAVMQQEEAVMEDVVAGRYRLQNRLRL